EARGCVPESTCLAGSAETALSCHPGEEHTQLLEGEQDRLDHEIEQGRDQPRPNEETDENDQYGGEDVIAARRELPDHPKPDPTKCALMVPLSSAARIRI